MSNIRNHRKYAMLVPMMRVRASGHQRSIVEGNFIEVAGLNSSSEYSSEP